MIRALTGRRATLILLTALVVAMPLCLGGAAPFTLPVLVSLAGLAFVTTAVDSARRGNTLYLPIPSWLLALSAAAILLQLVPLPPFLLGWLSRPAAEVRDFNLVPLGLTGWRPISLDPSATWRELAKHLAYLALFLSAAQLSRARRHVRRQLLASVVAAAALVALIGFAHALLNLSSLFGVFPFHDARPPFLTVFGNPNHAAVFMACGSVLALGLGFDASERRVAFVYWGLSVLTGVAVVLTLSRGGILFWLAGLALLGALMLRARKTRAEHEDVGARSSPEWVLVAALAVIAVGGFVAYEELSKELRVDDPNVSVLDEKSKVDLWPMMFRGGMKFAVSGMGRGAYESAFSRFQTTSPFTLYTHSENVVLQLLSELGLPLTAALLALALVWLRRILRRHREGATDFALVAVVVATVLHDLFDFSLEFAPTAVAVCLAIGVLDRPGPGQTSRRWSLPPRLLVFAAPALVVLALMSTWLGRPTLPASEKRVAEAVARKAPPAELRAILLEEVDRHPADFLLYGLASAAYADSEPREALAFANRALFLRPLNADAHHSAARALWKLKRRRQALLEYGLAYEAMRRERNAGAVLTEGLVRAKGLEELQLLVPSGDIDGLSNVARYLIFSGRMEEAGAFLTAALEAHRDDPQAVELWLWEVHSRKVRGDLEGALEAAAQAEVSEQGKARVAPAKADILVSLGRREEAVALLEERSARRPAEVDVAFRLVELHTQAGRGGRARAILNRSRPFLKATAQRQHAFSLEAATYRQEGRFTQALSSLQSAQQLAPQSSALWFAQAEVLEKLGRYADAIGAVERGMALDPQGDAASRKQWRSRLEELRARPPPSSPAGEPPSAEADGL